MAFDRREFLNAALLQRAVFCMKKLVLSLLVCVGGALQCLAAEDHVEKAISEVLGRVARLKAAQPNAVPMAFWDFDGTIIWGDVTLGSMRSKPYFDGLMKSAILAGLNNIYSGEEGWRKYFEDDRIRLRELAQWMAVPFRAQMYEGRTVAEMETFASARFGSDLPKLYFVSSIRIMNALRTAGVENHVISGSPDVFVRCAAESLGIPRDNIHGVRVAEKDGKLTTQLLYPLPVEMGKIDLMDSIVMARRQGIVIAGFGNDYRADGPFLKSIATQTLPGGGRGFAMMINGRQYDSTYDGLFMCVTQTELTSATP